MFKTKGYIEKFAKLLTDQMEMENYTKEQVCIAIEEVLKDFQKDLLESASKDSQDAWINYRKGEGHSFGHKEALDYGWQACALFHKAKIDTLKQRELEYQSDLRQKDAEIDRLKKLAYVGGVFNCPKCKLRLTATTISMTDGGFYENREPQQCSNGCGPMWMQTYKDEVKEARSGFNEIFDKYQEAVKDIEFLTSYLMDEYDSSFDDEYKNIQEIKTKYGLDKKEG